ncbi:Speckle-type POZ protein-like protein [Hordeum vulgare]|nr:Speckle-type POZ protein-like protein [Hordeum vulgare]
MQSGTGEDVTFIVSGESFPAHKDILSSRSPVFMAEFYGEMEEMLSDRVVIEDMEAAAFRAMLHFIYTDTVPELDQELEAVATMAQHLLAAADRYGTMDWTGSS